MKISEKWGNSFEVNLIPNFSMLKFISLTKKLLIIAFFSVLLTSCAQLKELQNDPEEYSSQRQKVMTKQMEKKDINLPEGSTILDDDSALNLSNLFDGIGGKSNNTFQVDSITFDVALDKVSFMPLSSVDSLAGIIVTDWYSLNDGNSRIKINVRIFDQEMSDDSLSVSLFTQTLSGERWVDEGINSEQSLKIKNSILSTARSLKVASEL